MKRLSEIAALYEKLDKFLEEQREAKTSPESQQIQSQQTLNDQAFFLLCWGQLETEVDETCRKIIRARRSQADWETRRGWDLYNPDDKRMSGLSFEDRTALVLDRSSGRGSPYARTMFHCQTRNEIAHGKLQSTRVDVLSVVQDFYAIQAALQRSSER